MTDIISEEKTDVTLPELTFVTCPVMKFEPRKAIKCFTCPHFKGITKATVNGVEMQGDIVNTMQMICAFPMTRKLSQITEE